jgi:hypothetical protein
MRRSGPFFVALPQRKQIEQSSLFVVGPQRHSCSIRAIGQAPQFATSISLWVNGSFSAARLSAVQTNFVRNYRPRVP